MVAISLCFARGSNSTYSYPFWASGASCVFARKLHAMTWDILIHTTYFDQPEVADMIAAHITARAREA
jgi:hypothetical protein